jgi:alanyl-tRNA synthetase
MTSQLYFDDPLKLEFEAEIIESLPLSDNRTGVVMPATYFYPSGGGQDHDLGTIADSQVVDVYKEAERIIHVLDRPLKVGTYPAVISRERRLRHMQHHTAQHVLTGSFVNGMGYETVSAHISGYSPSTIDLKAQDIDADDLTRVEDFANGILFENRIVKSYFVSDKETQKIPFRKPPAVSGQIRVIEVDGFDYSACGGTHCPQTGMVGLLKIVRTERINQKFRIHFVAGTQALEYFRQMQATAQTAAAQLGTSTDDLPDELGRILDQLKTAQVELKKLHSAALDVEAAKLLDGAVAVGKLRLVTAILKDHSAAELRSLAMTLRNQPGHVTLLAAFDGGKLSLVAACAEDTGVNAGDLLNSHLARFGCQGGGDAGLAQGGGVVAEDVLGSLFSETEYWLS